MRLWIAAFLLSLFAFQVLPVTVLGKCCVKAKISADASSEDESGDEDGSVPEGGKLKKNGGPVEDFDIHPGLLRAVRVYPTLRKALCAPERLVIAISGHATLDTPPPDRH